LREEGVREERGGKTRRTDNGPHLNTFIDLGLIRFKIIIDEKY
jgi:hypothetical protein